MARNLTFSGQATSPTWFVQHSPAEYEAIIYQSLLQAGWGVNNVHVTVNWLAAPTAYSYSFTVGVDALENENAERVKQAIVSAFLVNGVTVDSIVLTNDTAGIAAVPDDSLLHSFNQSLFGGTPSGATLGTVAGVSTGVLLAGGLLVLFLLSQSKPTFSFRR